MKVLYAIQGTGNGHLSRARDVIPALLKHNISLDLLVSGIQADIKLPYPIKYQLKGLSFIFGKKGGVDIWKTYYKANSMRLQKEIKSIPIENYDLIINDFEPVTAWACKLKNKPCYSFSHQAAVLSTQAPKPKKKDKMGKWILNNYAPLLINLDFILNLMNPTFIRPLLEMTYALLKFQKVNIILSTFLHTVMKNY
ncbi:glycosyltransferase family protein [Maribacter sp. Hel_I_7]|uniref:glycosyltransferase family protein n=1 Tax=Maribacter sp. Hel_I_7 TaxID=1249997 RepID=UPI000A810211|nr:glycosyltransferase family protein [Maribacter sp. Hel_I_7]